MILSKKKFIKNDDYILINTNKYYSNKFPKDVINFLNYKSINIYYGSNNFYFNKLCNRFKNKKLYFLELGVGNFLSFIQGSSINKNYEE